LITTGLLFLTHDVHSAMSVEELADLGMVRMDDDEIRGFLASQRTGVLGLPTDDGPHLLPLSFGFDGESTMYFTYVLGKQSRKEDLSDRAESATFLVYDAQSPFTWESVILRGPITEVPEAEYTEAKATLTDAWRPDIFQRAELTRGVKIYGLEITEWSGLKHTGLPPGFEPRSE
jgi:nitroimidazol reductase NimA-like FMN-containing flavoprotein (pyridoxamine 5'-phosphate oxidase superfamily)